MQRKRKKRKEEEKEEEGGGRRGRSRGEKEGSTSRIAEEERVAAVEKQKKRDWEETVEAERGETEAKTKIREAQAGITAEAAAPQSSGGVSTRAKEDGVWGWPGCLGAVCSLNPFPPRDEQAEEP